MKTKAVGVFSSRASLPSGDDSPQPAAVQGGAAAQRTLDGEDRGERIAEGGKNHRKGQKISRYRARRAIFSRWHDFQHSG